MLVAAGAARTRSCSRTCGRKLESYVLGVLQAKVVRCWSRGGFGRGCCPQRHRPSPWGTTPTYLSPFICICRLRHRAMLAHQLNSHLAALPHAYSGRPCRGGACGAARRPLPVRSFMGSLENLVRRPCFPPVCCERAASGVSPACQLATWGARLPDGLPQPVPRCGCGCRRAG